jgi:ferric-dicitrate binding protein FerR (iron transport regulator)
MIMKHIENYFLNDDNFILWRLTGDSELDEHWNIFIKEHPEMKDDFDAAIAMFKSVRLNDSRLIEEEIDSIATAVKRSGQAPGAGRRSIIRYAAAACITVVLAAGAAVYYYGSRESRDARQLTCNTVTGENLEAEDIILITGDETNSFSNDVKVKIDGDGTAIVSEAGSGESKIVETGKTKMNTLVAPYGKRAHIELTDGTKVWLNSGSALDFPTSFTGKTRTISLTGEMYIEVAPDSEKPFTVNANGLNVVVKGTKFNISAYRESETQSVVLAEGSVCVKSAACGETTLRPNEMLTCGTGGWETRQVDVNEYLSWTKGYILLNRTPMEDVLKRIGRYYNLSFNIPDNVKIASKTCSGKIMLSENLDDVMNTVAMLTSARYTREDHVIHLIY